MTNITLRNNIVHCGILFRGSCWCGYCTGVALWGGSIPAVAVAGFSALTLAILLGMVFRQHHLSAHLEKL